MLFLSLLSTIQAKYLMVAVAMHHNVIAIPKTPPLLLGPNKAKKAPAATAGMRKRQK